MYLEVYPDIVFILNFIIDFILLLLLKKVNKKSGSMKRLMLAAAIGALFAAVLSVFPWCSIILRLLLFHLIGSVLMILTAFGKMKKMELMKQVAALYLITYFAGGLINSIYYYTNFRLFLFKVGEGLTFSNISGKFVIVIVLILAPVSLLLLKLFRQFKKNAPETYEVELFYEGRSIKVRGLMDTGNCLYDPVYHKPVMVAEASVIEKLLPPEVYSNITVAKGFLEKNITDVSKWNLDNNHILRLRFIPYRSVGKSGVMPGIILDKVIINTGEESICEEKVTTAISDQCLSDRNDYNVILHKELL